MLEDLIQERLKKRGNLIQAGHNPYPARAGRRNDIGDVLRRFFFLSLFRIKVSVGGRVMGFRVQGGVMFVDLKDESGKIQAVFNKKSFPDFNLLKENLDIGDFLAASGRLFKTKKGQKSVLANKANFITKSLRPLPSEWYGLKDVEERYRRRYLDLIMNSDAQLVAESRSKIVRRLRTLLDDSGFLEVETPMLQELPGGANARPFVTHHNALDRDFYLRIAPELFLKRLLAGGMEKIFEIGRLFRNEGMDRDHNPEFTSMELYWAYQDYGGLIIFLEKVLKTLWQEFRGGEWTWEKKTFSELFLKNTGKLWDSLPAGKVEEVYKREIRLAGKIKKTVLVTDYPEIIMPLAKLKAEDPRLTESFQLIAGSEDTGMAGGPEIMKGFSEMNDPVVQREQMQRQEEDFRAGNEEASRLDEDFLETLEYGMPSAAGVGIGIDRLVMLLTKANSLKEAILFPTLKPKK